MASTVVLLALNDGTVIDILKRAVLGPAGYQITACTQWEEVEIQCRSSDIHVLIADVQFAGQNSMEQINLLLQRHPAVAVLLLTGDTAPGLLLQAMRAGVMELLQPPLRSRDVLKAVERAVQRGQRMKQWAYYEGRRSTQSLQQRLHEMETLARVGRSVTSQLDLDNVLTTVVEAAVELTGAEEGSLLLLDEATGELFARAARNLGDEFVKTFRLPVMDTLAGQVVQTGEPILINDQGPQKIKTTYLVHSLMYVPLRARGKVIGVLGVDNRREARAFQEDHQALVSAIADYAAVAIENARLYIKSESERQEFEAILTHVEDGVIVVDFQRRVVFVNRSARATFKIKGDYLTGQSVYDLIPHPDLQQVFSLSQAAFPTRRELALDDGRWLNAQVTSIPEVGLVVTMQDITQLKELDRLKNEFVSTVSHDLRSPLTAILGYVELLDRVGPLNEMQTEFIRRVHTSVENITNLINELLDLGRIEAGFDTQKEPLAPATIIHFALEDLKEQAQAKRQQINLELIEPLPAVFASPTRLQQVLTNLIGNAIKYTPEDGRITVRARPELQQLVIEVIDNGSGIPLADQPYIFNKFYRASNTQDSPGTGLGLAIVKSIVESHHGRVWAESTPGQGSIFTVVLPVLRDGAARPDQSSK